MVRIIISKSAIRTLRRMEKKTANRIHKALRKLAEDPDRRDLDIERLKARQGYRLRIGKTWRILFDRDDDIITVQVIKPRGQVYRR